MGDPLGKGPVVGGKQEKNNIMVRKITNKTAYNSVMQRVDALMKKGDGKITEKESSEIRKLALAAQAYEKTIYIIPAPSTLEGMIELRMYELRLKQHELANKLGVSTTKLSLVLNGKQKPDLSFIKAVHIKLNIDADFILQHI